jgi:hypothetical protein
MSEILCEFSQTVTHQKVRKAVVSSQNALLGVWLWDSMKLAHAVLTCSYKIVWSADDIRFSGCLQVFGHHKNIVKICICELANIHRPVECSFWIDFVGHLGPCKAVPRIALHVSCVSALVMERSVRSVCGSGGVVLGGRACGDVATSMSRSQPPSTASHVTTLPAEMFFRILSFLHPSDLCAISAVCRRWHGLSNDEQIWHNCCARGTLARC